MPKLKLPRRPLEGGTPPPELRRLVERGAGAALGVLLTRREFLRAAALAAAALGLPLRPARRAWARSKGRFFTRRERTTLAALTDRILPPDHDPGARALGVPDYIEGLLTAFDAPGTPRIFAGGPFSNRNPFPDNDAGRPSRRRPRNDFATFIPLSRLQAIRWRAELFGSAAEPRAAFNDAALGALRGLRDIYREGLATVDQAARAMHGRPFARLSPARQDAVFDALDRVLRPDPRRGTTFLDVVIQHTLEGAFAAPEYGGNHRRRGWRMLGLEGDDQPLGYSIFSRATNGYLERPAHPMSTPNPDEVRHGRLRPRKLSPDGDAIEQAIFTLTGSLP
ncbi:MAG TPA: gluconate 2-dehydrogenase subunit 3 family protein [Candidatus Binatia bacterium]|jgi:hypothetical protein|nr:gluconate 2-dehydrogenase subunit 3 family protein [Candidatus Binatia bacterium]